MSTTDQTTDQLHPIFRECCMPEDQDWPRYDMHRPFVLNGYVYATDGRIVVRTEMPDTPDTEHIKVAPVESQPWTPDLYESQALPHVEISGPIPQPTCDQCEGVGVWEGFPCPNCDGEGRYENPRRIEYRPSLRLNEKYVRIIQKYGGTIYPHKQHEAALKTGYMEPVRFVTNGGVDGLLAPLYVDDDQPTENVIYAEPTP